MNHLHRALRLSPFTPYPLPLHPPQIEASIGEADWPSGSKSQTTRGGRCGDRRKGLGAYGTSHTRNLSRPAQLGAPATTPGLSDFSCFGTTMAERVDHGSFDAIIPDLWFQEIVDRATKRHWMGAVENLLIF